MPGIESGLTDIALRGLEAARLLVDRFVDAADRPPDEAAPAAGEPDDQRRPSDRATEDLARAWTAILRTMSDAWQGVAPGAVAVVPGPLVAGHPGTVVPLHLPSDATSGTAELWLHNPTTEPVTAVRIVAGALTATEGHVLTGAVVAEPAEWGDVPGRSSRAVTLTVDVPPGTPAGRYRGLVLVDGMADTWAVLDVTIGSPA